MPVDRSLLPELPGKPEWYIENAPKAVERPRLEDGVVAKPPTDPAIVGLPAQSEPGTSVEASQVPTVGTQPSPGKGRGKVKALAGKLRH